MKVHIFYCHSHSHLKKKKINNCLNHSHNNNNCFNHNNNSVVEEWNFKKL